MLTFFLRLQTQTPSLISSAIGKKIKGHLMRVSSMNFPLIKGHPRYKSLEPRSLKMKFSDFTIVLSCRDVLLLLASLGSKAEHKGIFWLPWIRPSIILKLGSFNAKSN